MRLNTECFQARLNDIYVQYPCIKDFVHFHVIAGNVDIWSLQTGSSAFQSYSPSTRDFPVTSLCLSKNSKTLVTKYGPIIDVLYTYSEEEFHLLSHLDTGKEVNYMLRVDFRSKFSYSPYTIHWKPLFCISPSS